MAKVLDPSTSPRTPLAKRLALGGVALTAGAVATLGLVGYHTGSFHHESARLLAEIASAKGVQVTLRDRTGLQVHGMLLPKTSVASDKQIAFDGRISYDFAGEQFNFTLVDDRAYLTVADLASGRLTRTGCINPENVPPIATFTDALKNARVVDAVEGFNVTCASGKLVEFDFAGEPYVLCSNVGSDGPGTVQVVGDDLEVSLNVLTESSEGVPSLASLAPPSMIDMTKCDQITTSTGDASLVATSTSTASRLLQRTQDAIQVATGGRRLASMASTDCSTTCREGKKQCLFVHGFGHNDTGAATDSFDYFGTIEKSMPCCTSIKFVHLDTNNEAWYSDKLTSKVCNTAIEMTQSKNPLQLENLAVVAHSMGNLIFSAAIMDGKCGLAKSSKWISLAGPIYGSPVSTTFVTAMEALPPATREAWCSNDPNTILDDPIYSLLDSSHLCSTLTSLKSIVAKGSARSTAALDALFTAAGETFKANVGASLCGVSAIGLLSADSAKQALTATVGGFPSVLNDGQVHYDSCRGSLPESKYSTKWNGGAFYRAGLNHADIAMRHGDGWWGDDRKPVKWLQCQF